MPQEEKSDGTPQHVDPEKTRPLCPHCGSDRLQVYPGMCDENGRDLFHCHACLKASLLYT